MSDAQFQENLLKELQNLQGVIQQVVLTNLINSSYVNETRKRELTNVLLEAYGNIRYQMPTDNSKRFK